MALGVAPGFGIGHSSIELPVGRSLDGRRGGLMDGLYVMGAAVGNFHDLWLRVEWMETFAMAPVDSALALSLGWDMPGDWFGGLGLTLVVHYRGDWRSVEKEHSGVSMTIDDQRQLLGIGVQVDFAALGSLLLGEAVEAPVESPVLDL